MPAQNIQIWPDWRIVRELGRGSFGEVYEINRQNGNYLEKVALRSSGYRRINRNYCSFVRTDLM